MSFRNPFEQPGQWYKANHHTHTTTSDGEASPEERVRQYHGRGYQVLALTDHGATNDTTGMSTEDMLVISGMESHPACEGTSAYHLVLLNVPHGFAVPPDSDAGTQIQMAHDAGGETIIAHPYWCGHNLSHLLPLEGAMGIEVYNSTCTRIGKGYSSVQWDDLLQAGRYLPASACDDTHAGRDIFMGWTMVRSEALDPRAILDALREGCCYATCGPEIRDCRMQDGVVTVECSPAAEVHFMCAGSSGTSHYADEGPPIECASFTPNPSRGYVRVEVIDARGRHAWTNPFLL